MCLCYAHDDAGVETMFFPFQKSICLANSFIAKFCQIVLILPDLPDSIKLSDFYVNSTHFNKFILVQFFIRCEHKLLLKGQHKDNTFKRDPRIGCTASAMVHSTTLDPDFCVSKEENLVSFAESCHRKCVIYVILTHCITIKCYAMPEQ